jgi:hypothetical protein
MAWRDVRPAKVVQHASTARRDILRRVFWVALAM